MSSDQMHPYHQQPHPFRIPHGAGPSQPSAYHYPYSTAPSPQQHFQAFDRQPVAIAGLRAPLNMPNYSSLTNAALFNVLTRSEFDHENEHEHEYEHQGFSFSTLPPELPATPASQPRRSLTVAKEQIDLSEEDQLAQTQAQTAAYGRGSKKQQKRKTAALSESDDEYVEATQGLTRSPQVSRKPRRSKNPKHSLLALDTAISDDNGSPPPVKEKRPKRASTAKRQKKERPGRLIRKKPIGMSVPKSLNEAGPADRMMWQWKNQGRNWEEIRAEWKKITGVEPGGSSLSVRYIKLVENLARNGAAGDIELLRFKREAEDELLSRLWEKVAEKMLAFSSESEHNPRDLQKRYNMIVRSGYDVEQIVAEDKIKRENEQNHESLVKVHQAIHDFNADMEHTSTYNDTVANETAAQIGQRHLISSTNPDDAIPHDTSIAAVSEDSTFEATVALQREVDGPNEYDGLNHIKQDAADSHDTETLMPCLSFAPISPLPAAMQQSDHLARSVSACSTSLVYYSSDSE